MSVVAIFASDPPRKRRSRIGTGSSKTRGIQVALLKERLGIADGRLIFGTQNLEDHQPLKNYEIAPRSVIEVTQYIY